MTATDDLPIRELVVNLFEGFGEDEESRIRILKDAGFDGFFNNWGGKSDTLRLAEAACDLGMDFQSVHAPFHHVRALWGDDEAAASAALGELLACVEDCRRTRCGGHAVADAIPFMKLMELHPADFAARLIPKGRILAIV